METRTLDVTVPAAHARTVVLKAGEYLCITNTKGKQVADLIAFNAEDLSEYLSTNHTIVSVGSLFPTTGATLSTVRVAVLVTGVAILPSVPDSVRVKVPSSVQVTVVLRLPGSSIVQIVVP